MACENGHSKIAEMLIQKSAELNIDKAKIHLTTLDPKIGHFRNAVNFKSHFGRKFKKIFRALTMA